MFPFDVASLTTINIFVFLIFIDVIGVCKNAGPVGHIIAKNSGKEFTKRDITLVDKSNTEVSKDETSKISTNIIQMDFYV